MQQLEDDLQGLFEPGIWVTLRIAELFVVACIAASAEAQHQAPTADLVNGIDDLGDQRRVAIDRSDHHRLDRYRRSHRRHCAQYRGAFPLAMLPDVKPI